MQALSVEIPRFVVRRVPVGVCALAGMVSAAALVLDVGNDSARWIFAWLFATSVLAFFCLLARGDEAAVSRVGLLQQELMMFRSARDELEQSLERCLAERDAAVAARDEALRRHLPLGAAIAERVSAGFKADRDAARTRVVELERRTSELTARLVALTEADAERLARIAGLEADVLVARARADATDGQQVRLRSLEAELLVARNRAEAEGGLQVRLEGLEAEVLTSRGRAEAAEAAVSRLEAVQRETQRTHAAEIANARAATNRLADHPVVNRIAAAEVESLRTRLEEAQAAIRMALRELGVEDPDWPATVAGITRAAGPLTLVALGEDVPGWKPEASDDTLASAVFDLGRRAAEGRRQLDRALARSSDRR